MNKRLFFSSLHPAFLFSFFASELLITMFSQNPLMLLISLAGAVLFYAVTRNETGFSQYRFVIVLAVLIIITNPLFSQNGTTVLFYLGDLSVTLESFLYGVNSAIAVSSVIFWFKSINIIMTDDKSEYLFGRVAPKTSLILTMALRFIPLYKKQLKDITEAQKGLGLGFGGKIKTKFKTAGDMFLLLVTLSLEDSVDTGLSMKARGYGEKGRTSFVTFKFKAEDLCLSVLLGLSLIVVIIGFYKKSVDFVFYPALSPLKTDLVSVLTYLSFAVMSFLPFIFEAVESLKWKYYLSKN